MIYVDFDGVILDTEDIAFKELRKNIDKTNLTENMVINYLKNLDWQMVLTEASEINDAISILKNADINRYTILTKIHSLENEGVEKIKYLRKRGIQQNIILVPYNVKKSEIVNPNGNILIDDCLKNLDEWKYAGGYPIFFDRKNNNIDSWNVYNVAQYARVQKIIISQSDL